MVYIGGGGSFGPDSLALWVGRNVVWGVLILGGYASFEFCRNERLV